jgi:hypothetical protein
MVKKSLSLLTPASQKKLAKMVSLDELAEGARCTTEETRQEWENRMIEKYGLVVK